MAKLLWEKDGGVVFEGTLGRKYDLPFHIELVPRAGSNGRKGGSIGGTARDEAGEICLRWGTKPAMRVAFESLEKDYDLSGYITDGAAMPPEREARGAREGGSAEEPATHLTTDAGLMLFRSIRIGMRGFSGAEEMCLTDMWRANGADPKKDVYEWTRSKQARELVDFLNDSAEPGESRFGFLAEKGGAAGGGGTWAHWQLAFAYAKYLSPAFHTWVNRAAREKMSGRAPSGEDPMKLALRILGREGLELRAAVDAADEKASRAAQDASAAKATAEEAKAVAEEARTAARAAVSPAVGMVPGTSRRVPEGAVIADAPQGFLSMRGVARRFGLPLTGKGANFVGRVADATKVDELAGATWRSAVVAGGHEVNRQRRFGPLAVDHMRSGLVAAVETMKACGYTALGGAMEPVGVARRAHEWVLQRMLEAAASAAMPLAARPRAAEEQQALPGVNNDTQPKAS